MKEKIKAFLTTIRVFDRDGVVSLTNIIVYAALLFSIFRYVDLGFLLVAAALYGLGRWINYKRGQVISDATKVLLENQRVMQEQLNEQKNKLTSLSTKAGLYPVMPDNANLRRW